MLRFFDKNQIPPNETKEVTETRVLQPIWDLRFLSEDFVASPVFPVILTVSVYFLGCSVYAVADMFFNKLPQVQKYKIQTDKTITWKQVTRALRVTAMNNFLFILPATIAQYIWVPPTPLPAMAPPLFDFVYQMWAMLMLFDFQYWVWHSCHHKNRWLYRNFHSLHHQYHSTFSWTTQYLHPWEISTVGFFATVDGWFFNCHPMTYWAFMVLNVIVSIDAHSGYDIPIFPHHWIPFGLYGGGPKHDMHHMRPMTNFQPFFSTFDRLMGWECPGLRANGLKTKELIAWEEKNKSAQDARLATQMMIGTENGLLEAMPDDYVPCRKRNPTSDSSLMTNGAPPSSLNGITKKED